MLAKAFRLSSKVRKFSLLIYSPYCVIKVAQNNENISRFGFVVSKRIDKRAVVRNRIKRTLRGFIEDHLGEIKKGHDFLFVSRKNFPVSEKKEVVQSLESEFQKQGFIE